MKFKTHEAVAKDLQAIADQVGAKGYDRAKALYLEGVVVTDTEGNVLPPESLTYEVKIMAGGEDSAPPADVAMAEEEAKASDAPAAAEKSIRSTIRETIAQEIKSAMTAPRVAVIEPFKIRGKVKYCKTAEEAYRFGQWFFAAKGSDRAKDFCRKNGIPLTKGHTEGINTEGGYLVPEEFEETIITLRETYGVFRRNAKVWPMSNDTLRLPRRKSGLTAYAVGEAVAGTESTQKFEQISLVAQKFMVLTTVSNELNEDAMVNIGDDVAQEIAQAFAQREDECGFIGDGGADYSGIVGVRQALRDVDGTLSNCKGIVDAGETSWDGIVIGDFNTMMARLPAYADTPACKWYCSKAFYHSVMERVAYAAGGITYREIKEKSATPVFMGYPVEYVQVLDRTSTDGSIPLLFGDLAMAAYFGDRRSMNIAFSDSALNAFEQDEVAIRGTTRFDIKVPNVGDTTDAGPIIGLHI